MPEITALDKQSGMAKRLVQDLTARRDKLQQRCSRRLCDTPALEQILTAELRGQIKALNLLIKEFTTGLTSPVE